tara:strand:+ start:285 stop:512 length:228 start_codon:yes stop_codon:yes gene_type:complete
MSEIKLPSISMNLENSSDLNSSRNILGLKRELCDISSIKCGFKDVLEPAKKLKKMEEQAYIMEEHEIYHKFLLMN